MVKPWSHNLRLRSKIDSASFTSFSAGVGSSVPSFSESDELMILASLGADRTVHVFKTIHFARVNVEDRHGHTVALINGPEPSIPGNSRERDAVVDLEEQAASLGSAGLYTDPCYLEVSLGASNATCRGKLSVPFYKKG